jgi:hypothetical protein
LIVENDFVQVKGGNIIGFFKRHFRSLRCFGRYGQQGSERTQGRFGSHKRKAAQSR